ncbi:spore coat protein U domain-containing protein [Amylibacter sp.]|nr:spore coat protein U domain-containing protein [Amylibacter sp.]
MVLLGLIAASGATVSSSGTGMSVNHVVYGRIPPRQNVRAGNYRTLSDKLDGVVDSP